MHKAAVISSALLVGALGQSDINLPNLSFKDIDDQPLDLVSMQTESVQIVEEKEDQAAVLEKLSNVANNAEQKVVDILAERITAENNYATAERTYMLDANDDNKEDKDEKEDILQVKKNALGEAKLVAAEARKQYAEGVADLGSNDELEMNGLDTNDNGTGIPGGLDNIGIDAARLFLPDQKLSAAQLKLELNKLKFQFRKRRSAIQQWERERILEADRGYLDKGSLEVLKKRTIKRLSFGKKKTDNYRTAVRELYLDYKRRYNERQLNKFQWEQIKTWARGKLQLSSDRYNAFRKRIVNKYKSQVERVALVKKSKRKQKTKAKALAKEQMKKNGEAYEEAKKRLMRQARQSPEAINGFESGLPKLVSIQGKQLDPLGGMDPFADMDGLDDQMESLP